jgi:hypothetical protein
MKVDNSNNTKAVVKDEAPITRIDVNAGTTTNNNRIINTNTASNSLPHVGAGATEISVEVQEVVVVPRESFVPNNQLVLHSTRNLTLKRQMKNSNLP